MDDAVLVRIVDGVGDARDQLELVAQQELA
jgi:hypothetical protein